MGLIGTNRGSGSNVTSDTTVLMNPLSNFNPSSLAILCVTYDNSVAGGADPFSTITDSLGNVWTSRQNQLNDPGAANAGNTLRVFTAYQTSSLTTTSGVTMSFGATSVPVKTWTFTEVSASYGSNIIYSAGSGSISSSTTPSITSTSIPSASLILAVISREQNSTRVGDSDTTNGSWSVSQSFGSGSTTSGQEIISQFKIVTAAGTQTYNPTFNGTSADSCAIWIQIDEEVISLGSTYVMVWSQGEES